mmetsp:Transcript_1601/g.2862  ORF Transcript_1601/g.2862 Transcript_1601/m.2862 type:complete len:83 (-) Transcript_1601:215-463(-)|eukprot:CAMPEP_0202495872 /NCGR_PEP_ID=MMETSP1361-20130828/18108_1 /ASSEMBLY_ACC=CAM_ASM_000849 /TAXON_ID=210615 /ORGANISM="Staurosira complex sp., Strain CCMP2646" /LENGTH=82 /DNA_ID=CAMNT_0049127045 /DNA_START=55 /DNA_END=303 /DNA_ORIENTATION=+
MGFSLWNLFKAGLLCTNAILILNRRRFLAKYGLDDANNNVGGDPSSLKVQAIGLLQAVQYLKVPVIAANAITIIFEMILGGT